MARYKGPKSKISRRYGEPIFGDTKALALLQGLNSLIHNHSHTTFEIFMADIAKKTKMSPNSHPMEILEKLMNQLDSEDNEGRSPIPDSFLKAFEENEDE